MRQASLFETLGLQRDTGEPPDVYDFFAGAGGFSCGAHRAGCRVAWACDNDPLALRTHAKNHPETTHVLAELPLKRSQWPFPTDGRRFHAHFSPPCQRFSQANMYVSSKKEQAEGSSDELRAATRLVRWSLRVALTCGASTWSFEQVPSKRIIALVERAKRQHPGRVEYAVVDFVDLGLPQSRKRLIAGSPHLIAKLGRHVDPVRRASIAEAIAAPRGTHVRNGCYSKSCKQYGLSKRKGRKRSGWGEHLRSVREPSFTVLANRGLNWITRTATGIKKKHPRLNTREYAALQSFPDDYHWPEGANLGMRQVGNSVPPLVASLLMGAATIYV